MRSARELLNSLELACWSVDGIRRDEAVEFLQEVQREAIEAAAEIAMTPPRVTPDGQSVVILTGPQIAAAIRALLPTDTKDGA